MSSVQVVVWALGVATCIVAAYLSAAHERYIATGVKSAQTSAARVQTKPDRAPDAIPVGSRRGHAL